MDSLIGPEFYNNAAANHLFKVIQEDESIRVVAEIGASAGLGSTSVITRALERREGAAFYPIEVSKGRMKHLLAFYRQAGFVHPVLGSTCSVEEFPTREEYQTDIARYNITEYDVETAVRWMEQDKAYLQVNQDIPTNALDLIPRELDLILIDGSESLGFRELLKVLPRMPRYIALDDIYVFKNARSVELLDRSKDYECVVKLPVRNGYALYRRVR